MKRLLLVMGMVGCGGGDEDPPAGETALPATPKNEPHAKVDEPPVQAVGTNPSVASESVSPKTPADTVDDTPAQADDVDPVASLKKLGAQIEQDDQGRVVELNLWSTLITDAGLVHIKGMTKLKQLNLLFNKKVTDAGLVNLKGLTKLENLGLTNTNITDAGLVHLKGLTNLQTLSLSRCNNITDAGLVHLKGLTTLTFLDIKNTQITDAGIAELQQALPNCDIRK